MSSPIHVPVCAGESAVAPGSRREFLQRFGLGLGSLALADLLRAQSAQGAPDLGILPELHHPARAKRVIYLFQSGGPSQLDTFDYKP
ncbi:MAG: DUF1501 domain-containing protein, partial [Planctomycetota bacterium]|nr:DUF1501 domain-containing protein [Planctomycetota bacterium]